MDATTVESVSFDPQAALAPLRRALALRQSLHWTGRGLCLGAAVGALLLLTRHFVVFSTAPRLALAAVCVGAASGAAMALHRRPTTLRAARAADDRFSLNDRLTTALELRESSEPLALLQRRDVSSRIRGLRLSDAASISPARHEIPAASLAVVLFAVTLVLPSATPPRVALARSVPSGLGAGRQAALAHLQVVRRSLMTGLTPVQRSTSGTQLALATLSRLQAQIRAARTQDEALRDVSAAQSRLQRAASGLHPVSHQAARQLAQSLPAYLSRQQKAQATKGGAQLARTLAGLLRHLGGTTKGMTAKEKQQLAAALQAAANAQSSSQLKSDLSQASSALGHNDAKTAGEALKHAAKRLAASPNDRMVKSRLHVTSKQLDGVKNDLSHLHRKQSAPPVGNALHNPTNAPGSSQQGGKDLGGTSGFSSRIGQISHGKGNRSRGTRNGDLRKLGGGLTQAGTASGKANAVVFVPGLATQGQHILPIEIQSAPKSVPVVPYQQVIARYGRSARTALDRSSLPPSLRGLVRTYFTTLAK